MASPFLIVRLVYSTLLNTVCFALMLFTPAGTWNWWRAWVLIGVILVGSAWTMFAVFLHDEALLRERMGSPIQKGQPLIDQVILLAFIASFLAAIAFVPADVFRLHVFARPPAFASALGLVAFVAGWLLISFTFKANSFAAPVVKHQAGRGQRVIDHGPYRFVRHPMYAGGLCLMLGLPLWLESLAGVLVAVVPITLLAIRIVFEERFLQSHLSGYGEFTERVRFRLIPFVW